MLGLDTTRDYSGDNVKWSSRSAEEVAILARWSLFDEKIIKLTAKPVGTCNCLCRKKYLDQCAAKVKPKASNFVRANVLETLHDDPEERRIRRIKAYNNL